MSRIEIDDVKHDYITPSEAREADGLRMVLGAYRVPAPWRESCKGIFHVKGLQWQPVHTSNDGSADLAVGMNDTQSDLIAWTAQASAPVVAWNDEPPASSWLEQLYLAERLQPEPRLLPEDIDQRALMIGLINELMGRDGLIFNWRHLMVFTPLQALPDNDEQRAFFEFIGSKYQYSEENAKLATRKMVAVLNRLDQQLAAQKAAGSSYLIGNSLSALDIYWSGTCGVMKPMDEERCPMGTDFRGVYGTYNDDIETALTPALLAHRDYIYDKYLELPISW